MKALAFGLEETGAADYRSAAEREFLESLERHGEQSGWFGDAWLLDPSFVTISVVVCVGGVVRRTLRADFYGSHVCLGDDSTHQLVDALDPCGPEVTVLRDPSPSVLAAATSEWVIHQLSKDRTKV